MIEEARATGLYAELEVADMLQTPAFLARQTDLIEAVARSGRPANLKKAQLQAPGEMHHVLAKARAALTLGAGLSAAAVKLNRIRPRGGGEGGA